MAVAEVEGYPDIDAFASSAHQELDVMVVARDTSGELAEPAASNRCRFCSWAES